MYGFGSMYVEDLLFNFVEIDFEEVEVVHRP